MILEDFPNLNDPMILRCTSS